MKWTPAKDAELRRMIAESKSASQAGAALGVSRNAAIGRAHRLKLHFQGSKSNPRPHTKVRKDAGVPRKPVSVAPARTRKVGGKVNRTRIKPPVALPPCKPVDFMGYAPDPMMLALEQLTSHTCKWPHGDPRDASFGFCGAETSEPPYCQFHARIAYQPARERRAA